LFWLRYEHQLQLAMIEKETQGSVQVERQPYSIFLLLLDILLTNRFHPPWRELDGQK